MAVSLPEELSFRDEADLVANLQYRVHVVSVHDRGHVELLGQVADLDFLDCISGDDHVLV